MYRKNCKSGLCAEAAAAVGLAKVLPPLPSAEGWGAKSVADEFYLYLCRGKVLRVVGWGGGWTLAL